MGFGKSSYNNQGSFAQYKVYSLSEEAGPQRFRIFPPMHSLENDVKGWAKYHSAHWGYKGVDRNDPTKTKARTFKCLEQKNMRTGMVSATCPECDFITKETLALKEIEIRLATNQSEAVESLLQAKKNWLRFHNVDRKFYLNVMTENGELGVLKITSKCKKALELELDLIAKEEGVDPTDVNSGCWIQFTRTGQGIQVQDKVERVYERTIENGKKVSVLKLAPVSPELQEQALKTLPDLSVPPMTRVLSREQVQALTECSGEPEEVDAIMGLSQRAEGERSPEPETVATPTTAPAPKAPAKAAPTQSPTKTAPKATQPTPQVTEEVMSDEEFMAKFSQS